MKTKLNKIKFADLPAAYAELCGVVVPRPIHDRSGYENALEILEAMAGFGEDFNEDRTIILPPSRILSLPTRVRSRRRSNRARGLPSKISNILSKKME